MSDSLIPYAKVRVIKNPGLSIDIFVRSSKRSPCVGDEAVIDFINENNGLEGRTIGVTCYDAQGELEWVSLFTADELELLESAGPQLILAPLPVELSPESPQLFVWREWDREWYRNRNQWLKSLNCIYCNAPLKVADSVVYPPDQDTHLDTEYYLEAVCCLCGWAKRRWASFHTEMPGINSGRWATFRQMRSFEISDPQIALHELASHLKRRYTDIHSITPRRFEELIAEIFRSLGWDATLTQQTRDNGVDIYLFNGSSGSQAIVECKRYKNTVGIEMINRLLGVQLAMGQDRAYLVTSSKFSRPAQARAQSPEISKRGFELNLIDAEQLLRHLGVFNTDLPALHLHKTFNR